MSRKRDLGITRVLDKLKASVENGNYYEAHQMYRTLYFRYLGQSKYGDLLKLLYDGATIFLEHDQQGSGADLAYLLVETLVESKWKVDEEWIVNLTKLFALMSSTFPEREKFLSNATKWTMDTNNHGNALFHKYIAEVYWKERTYSSAHLHFMHSNDAVTYANMLIELQTLHGIRSEIDLFVGQAVLQLLCLRNRFMAMEIFNNYTTLHPILRQQKRPFLFPLLNFLWLLFQVIEKKQRQYFIVLRKCYATMLERDPNYTQYLDKIGRLWLDMEPPRTAQRSIGLMGLLRSVMGAEESVQNSDDEDCGLDTTVLGPDLD